jgi:alkylated DNA repair dioxygenase AlkB
MAWTPLLADDEKELGQNPVIASISLGVERRFTIRAKADHKDRVSISLPHNSLLLMEDSLQHTYEHQVPKQTKVTQPRVNLTFRKLIF